MSPFGVKVLAVMVTATSRTKMSGRQVRRNHAVSAAMIQSPSAAKLVTPWFPIRRG